MRKRYENWILPLFAMGISALLMGIVFDFYYDLNDDTLMRDIMSGVYSGTPDGHNMQTLYPLGAAIALCYRLWGSFPWYGMFLFLCQFGCFFLVGVRLCTLADAFAVRQREKTELSGTADAARARKQSISENDGAGDRAAAWRHLIGKLLCLLVLLLFQWGVWLTHMVNVQYTITCGMLAGTAAFLFLTLPHTAGEAFPARCFLMKSLPSLLLFLLAFCLRSEMALLVLPFLGLAGAFCWWEDRPVFTGANLKQYGGLLLLLLVGMGVLLGVDAFAYGGEWREFRQLFDDRTTIYDFYREVVTEDRFDADLEELGVSYGAQILLENYNFGLDEKIDAQMFADVAVYAKESVGGARDWGAIFLEKMSLYRYRSFHRDDAPYNLLVMLGYAANIISIVILSRGDMRKSRGESFSERISLRRAMGSRLLPGGLQLLLLLLVRTALWMFILMRGRDPERITHPLYLAEFCLLAGLFMRRLRSAASVQEADAVRAGGNVLAARNLLLGAASVFLLLSVWGIWSGVPAVRADQARRQEVNQDRRAINDYCMARANAFYFEDVYSTVAFSEKLLECRRNEFANHDIVGGWMCKSPLYRKKLAICGIEEAADALAQGEADFVMSDEEVRLRGLTWLMIPFAEKGLDVYVDEYDRIGEHYGVYQIIPVSEDGKFLREAK